MEPSVWYTSRYAPSSRIEVIVFGSTNFPSKEYSETFWSTQQTACIASNRLHCRRVEHSTRVRVVDWAYWLLALEALKAVSFSCSGALCGRRRVHHQNSNKQPVLVTAPWNNLPKLRNILFDWMILSLVECGRMSVRGELKDNGFVPYLDGSATRQH
jgi:hypothetical protein